MRMDGIHRAIDLQSEGFPVEFRNIVLTAIE
jgi:hypothetical protein